LIDSERDYPSVTFNPRVLSDQERREIAAWLLTFEPLDFEAARQTKLWIETNLAAGTFPYTTVFVFAGDGSDELFGCFVMDQMEVEVARDDIPIMQVRKAIKEPRVRRHPATKIVWMARSKSSPAGLGQQMFNHALKVAEEDGCCAVMVDAYDQETAEKLWIRTYHLRKPRPGAADWSCLWHSVGQADQSFN
jgi:hypothetical protein